MDPASLRNVFEFCSAQRAACRSEACFERLRNSSASATSGACARSIETLWFLDRCQDAATDELRSAGSAPYSTNLSHAARTSRLVHSGSSNVTSGIPAIDGRAIDYPLQISGGRRWTV